MQDDEVRKRQVAVKRAQRGEEPTVICVSLGRSLRWFYKWFKRSQEVSGDWFVEQPRRPKGNSRQTPTWLEQQVVAIRQELEAEGGFCGDQAVLWQLEERQPEFLPSLRTVARILARHKLVHHGGKRFKPKGKKYPALTAALPGDVHQTDFVGPCYLKGPHRFHSLHSVDLATGRCGIEPLLGGKTGMIEAIWSIWMRLGLPRFEQVDNEWVFFGSPAHPRGMGNLIRLCLPLEIEPVFIPANEPWRNGVVEKFNDHWQQKFFNRTVMAAPQQLLQESLCFEQRHNSRHRYSKLGGKTPLQSLESFGLSVRLPPPEPPRQRPLPKPEYGRYHLVRFIRSDGLLDIFSEKFELPPETHYEYVQATVDVERQRLYVRLANKIVEEFEYRLR
jgi:putative transposase